MNPLLAGGNSVLDGRAPMARRRLQEVALVDEAGARREVSAVVGRVPEQGRDILSPTGPNVWVGQLPGGRPEAVEIREGVGNVVRYPVLYVERESSPAFDTYRLQLGRT